MQWSTFMKSMGSWFGNLIEQDRYEASLIDMNQLTQYLIDKSVS